MKSIRHNALTYQRTRRGKWRVGRMNQIRSNLFTFAESCNRVTNKRKRLNYCETIPLSTTIKIASRKFYVYSNYLRSSKHPVSMRRQLETCEVSNHFPFIRATTCHTYFINKNTYTDLKPDSLEVA